VRTLCRRRCEGAKIRRDCGGLSQSLLRPPGAAALTWNREKTKMRVLKKIFIGLGSVFLVLLALFTWLGIQSVRFKHEEAPFVKAYLTDLSRRWSVTDVYNRSANTFVEQADSPKGQRTIESFKPLGALISIQDFSLKNYSDGTWGQRGVFDFKARFQNGEALVEVTILEKGHTGPRVLGIYLTGIQVNPGASGKMTT
jgi:hypothetical protein